MARDARAWRGLAVASRVVAAVGAGYALTAAAVTLAAAVLPLGLGLARSEAVVLAAMGGFVLYLVVLLWAFAEARLWRVWAVLGGGALLGHALVRGLAPLVGAG